MPELPDITIYIEALEKRILHSRLQSIEITSPFLLRTAAPPIAAALPTPSADRTCRRENEDLLAVPFIFQIS